MQSHGNNYSGMILALVSLLLALGLGACGGGGATGLTGAERNGGNPGSGTTGGNATQSLFDAQGGTSAFGIPSGTTGTISAGQQVFSASCAGCHGGGLPALSFSELKGKLALSPMSGISLSEQQIADLTAWLNRSTTPPPSTGDTGTGGTGTGGTGTGGTGTGTDDDDAEADDDNGSSAGMDDSANDDSGGADPGDESASDSGSESDG
jgi:hypothetical protein